MTLVGLDDTDSRERGMCTTYVATRIAAAVAAAGGRVTERRLVRLNPAVEWKTRGNAALCLETDLARDRALDLAAAEIEALAAVEDPRTSPGLVVAAGPANAVPDPVADFARRALRERIDPADARDLIGELGYRHRGWDGGRGVVGALAAVGAGRAFADWTYEHIVYRELDRCGTPRQVDRESVFDAARAAYPDVWDTVDRIEDEPVCVPSAPGPILYGIRGDDAETVRAVAADIESEPVEREATFLTNQGTDAHLRPGRVGAVADGRAYRVEGVVDDGPETRTGGHVHLTIRDGDDRLPCVAFEPTKRFRDRVRELRPGDRVTVCGEVGRGTLKLEKFALREPVTIERVVPTCPDCERSMESAGRDQGYRCRDCGTAASDRVTRALDRQLDRGWYEVPPCARRHVAKPLIRGGFDAPVHPER
ncbi:tRNA(Ile)(2)-agmatinylcytidine synthase [Haloplanus pelagicus]|uniref:tRNA(Ile)(2)-agmatinylcytidine synthase n=1 Tax=Haloplanus pelagicus TaxID=2949995 RepID=UPI00203FFC3A|nr:tRNA(Ile)(2)-agmatinylcytidine synthase [Haloplanus sp. HW8-1]